VGSATSPEAGVASEPTVEPGATVDEPTDTAEASVDPKA